MGQMSARERIDAVWRRLEPDQVPWSPMLGDSVLHSLPYYWNRLTAEQQFAIQHDYRYPSLVSLPNALDFQEAVIWEIVQDVGGAIITGVATVDAIDDQVETEAHRVSNTETRFRIRTPWGNLQETVAGDGSAETVYRTRFLISERHAYDIIARVIEERHYQARYNRFTQKQTRLGERGACMVAAPDQPLVTLFRVRDPAELIFDLVDEPDRMRSLLDLVHTRVCEAYHLIAQGPGYAVMTGAAFMTTRLISPRLFEKYVLPYLVEYADIVHRAGKILLCHMCGHIRALLPMLRDAHIDGIESLTNPPIGDTTLEEFFHVLGRRVILCGGIDATLLLNGTPDQLQSHTRDVLRRTHNRHVILATADEVPYGTRLENLRVIAQTIK
ncbi:MAG: hypothetical protein HY868_26795 [Chloroflexi bacterium]|nr:hypothetical protein [Chloroflexota bacterium]